MKMLQELYFTNQHKKNYNYSNFFFLKLKRSEITEEKIKNFLRIRYQKYANINDE